MAADYFGDSEDAAPSGAQDTPDKAEAHEDESGETALIPKALLAGKEFKPGEEMVVEIVHVYEDEVEIKYASEKKREDKKPSSQMDQADGAMEKMAKPMAGY